MSNFDYDDHLNQQDRKLLILRYEEMVESNENLYFDHRSLENIFEYYEERFEEEKLKDVVELALSLFPFSAYFLLKKAELFKEEKKYKAALEYIEKAKIYDPADIKLYLLKSDIFRIREEFLKAIFALEEADLIADKYEQIDLLLEKADVYQEWQKNEKFLQCIESVLLKDANNEEAQSRYIIFVELENNNERAVKFLNKLTDLDPYSVTTWHNLGNAYSNLELYEKAIEAIGFALAINDKLNYLHKDIGIAYCEIKAYNKAIEHFYEGIAIDEKDDECLYYIGKCFYEKQNFKQALQFLQKAVMLDDGYEQAWHQLALTFQKMEQSNAAFDAIKSALNFNENHEIYNQTAANICFALGNFEDALFYFNKIKDNNSTDEKMWYEMVENLIEYEEQKAALDLLDQVNDKIKSKAKWNYLNGIVLYNLGKKQQAFSYFENGLTINFNEHKIIFEFLPFLQTENGFNQLVNTYKNNK